MSTTTLREKIEDYLYFRFNDDTVYNTYFDETDTILKIIEDELNDLVVVERINHRSICSRTIRKIKERMHLLPEPEGAEKTSPEPTK